MSEDSSLSGPLSAAGFQNQSCLDIADILISSKVQLDKHVEERLKAYLQNFYNMIIKPN